MSNTLGFIEGWYPRIVDPIEKKAFKSLSHPRSSYRNRSGARRITARSLSFHKEERLNGSRYILLSLSSQLNASWQSAALGRALCCRWVKAWGGFICGHTLPVAGTCRSGKTSLRHSSKQLEGRLGRLSSCLSSPWTTYSFPPYIFSSESGKWASQQIKNGPEL